MRLACGQHLNAGHNVNQPVNAYVIDGLVLLEAEVRILERQVLTDARQGLYFLIC